MSSTPIDYSADEDKDNSDFIIQNFQSKYDDIFLNDTENDTNTKKNSSPFRFNLYNKKILAITSSLLYLICLLFTYFFVDSRFLLADELVDEDYEKKNEYTYSFKKVTLFSLYLFFILILIYGLLFYFCIL